MKKSKYIKISISCILSIFILSSMFVFAKPASQIKQLKADISISRQPGAAQNTVIKIDGQSRDLAYVETRVDQTKGSKNQVYKDDQENQYILNAEGKLTGYIKSNQSASDKSNAAVQSVQAKSAATFENRRQIADDYLKSFINVSDYECAGEHYIEDQKSYTITYYKMINGYKTSDFAFVTLNSQGAITAFCAPNVGAFDRITVPKIDFEQYSKDLKATISSRYPGLVDYSITHKIIEKTESGLNLNIYVNYEYAEKGEKYQGADIFTIPIN